MSDEHKIRIMIVDDHQVVRQGFAVFLKAFPDLEFVGEAVNGEEAVELAGSLQPDVILMDMIMPRLGGVDATRVIRDANPNIQVIALTSFTDNKQLVQDALNAGAIGYLFKDVSIADLAKAIRNRGSHVGQLIDHQVPCEQHSRQTGRGDPHRSCLDCASAEISTLSPAVGGQTFMLSC